MSSGCLLPLRRGRLRVEVVLWAPGDRERITRHPDVIASATVVSGSPTNRQW
jgi:hypothetical protein